MVRTLLTAEKRWYESSDGDAVNRGKKRWSYCDDGGREIWREEIMPMVRRGTDDGEAIGKDEDKERCWCREIKRRDRDGEVDGWSKKRWREVDDGDGGSRLAVTETGARQGKKDEQRRKKWVRKLTKMKKEVIEFFFFFWPWMSLFYNQIIIIKIKIKNFIPNFYNHIFNKNIFH